MFSYAKFAQPATPFTSSFTEPTSKEFSVKVNGKEIPVYTCNISKYPFNRPWPGKQRNVSQIEPASFVSLVSDEALELEVTTPIAHERVIIKPYAKNITHEESDGKIRFTLSENGHYVLQLDNYHHTLYIFNSKPISAPREDDVTYYFGPGVHFPGKITLKSNESIYVDKDALVYGCVFAKDAKNIRVFGNGLLDNSNEERIAGSCYEAFTNGNVKFYDCDNVSIEGVLMRNSSIWCVNIFHCTNFTVDNIKVFGQWRYNTDGIDIVNSQRVLIKNSFIHSFDDTVSIKGIDRYALTDVEDITIDNCVLWCDWGKACEIGVETVCRRYNRISFTNCDVLRGGNVALDVNNGECAEISDVLFENINVDFESSYTVEVFQHTDDQEYGAENTIMPTYLIWVGNRCYRDEGPEWRKDIKPGSPVGLDLTGIRQRMNRNVICKNINVYYDERIPRVSGKYHIPIGVTSIYPDIVHDNVLISNIKVNGKPLRVDEAMLSISGVTNFRYEFEDEYAELKKNTVSSENQLSTSKNVTFDNRNGSGRRIMFLGNSITRHGKAPQIGWNFDHGMAASSIDKDYIHLMMSAIRKHDPDAAFCICQAADFERMYKIGDSVQHAYSSAKDFKPDVIIMRIAENVPGEKFDGELFKSMLLGFLKYLGGENVKVILTTSFWRHPADEFIRRLAAEADLPLVELSDLGNIPEMKALGLFEHTGVANHPSDAGMKAIADRILDAYFNKL